ncbi:MAG: hypothetical protein CMJ64_25885 [Planctomycetaceae bacterium]|nr:hypothetical protein [Planctomycetaceae bacterium]
MQHHELAKRKPDFLRFGLGRFFLLFVLLAVLGAIVGPRIRLDIRGGRTSSRVASYPPPTRISPQQLVKTTLRYRGSHWKQARIPIKS